MKSEGRGQTKTRYPSTTKGNTKKSFSGSSDRVEYKKKGRNRPTKCGYCK